MFRDNEVTQVYVYDKPVDIATLTLQASEVDEVRRIPIAGLLQRFCFGISRLGPTRGILSGHIDWDKKLWISG